jgi:hypothetical protein
MLDTRKVTVMLDTREVTVILTQLVSTVILEAVVLVVSQLDYCFVKYDRELHCPSVPLSLSFCVLS